MIKENMRLRFIFTICISMFLAVSSFASDNSSSQSDLNLPALEEITKDDRVLILAPHPDDETIGCAGVIQKAIKRGAEVQVVCLTNGDHNQLSFIVYEKRLVFRKGEYLHMGQVRREESIKAMQILGLPKDKLIFLGYPDFGTMAIFKNYWNSKKPFRSLLTRVSSVPYKEDLSFGRPYIGESILLDLEEVIRKFKPTKIFVSHPADVNSDHRALYLFLKVALWDLRGQLQPNLKVYPYLVHHKGWPLPRHLHPELNLLPPADMRETDIRWQVLNLSQEELENKHQAILAYKSQTSSSAFYLLSFARENELFGDFSNIILRDLKNPTGLTWTGHPDILWEEEVEEELNQEVVPTAGSQIDYALNNGKVYIKLILKRQPIIRDLIFFIFGYKDSTNFREMPKIRLKVMGETVKVSDKTKVLKNQDIYFSKEGKTITVGVPLHALGDPQLILTSVYASSRGVSSEAAAWRVIELK